MNVHEFLKGRFVTAQDLAEGPLVVELERWSVERLPLGGEKVVVWFRDPTDDGQERGLPLNKTNLRRLAEILGSEDLDVWLGQKVELFRDDGVSGPSGRQGGVRVRPAPRASGKDLKTEAER